MSSWIEQEFALINLGDQRLDVACAKWSERMWQSPQSSIRGVWHLE